MNKYLIFLILFCLNINLFSQEILIDCGNPLLEQYSKNYFEKNPNLKSIKNSDTLELPFFDDFSNSYIYPDSTKWVDKYAFVNNDYAIDPVSVGVVSLDALDEFGKIYQTLSSSRSSIADYLTSQPINLAYAPSDSIYLSFFYQPGGNGNMPEQADSLVLQFRTPDTEWESVWNTSGGTNNLTTTFSLALIPVKEDKFLKKGFQFRFLNYVSISSNQELSWKSNADIWNLDYIKLDKNRSYGDTVMNDVAFLYPFKSILEGYESVPWKHFRGNSEIEIVMDTVNYIYRNMWNMVFNIDRIFYIIDNYTSEIICQPSTTGDSENINPLSVLEYSKAINCELESDRNDSASFVVTGIIDTHIVIDKELYGWNDTMRYYQNFYDYYSYDDGTAEAGYGIIGADGSVAYKFSPLITDTLQGVYMYFNNTLNDANRKYFYLTVWGDENGMPGEELQKVEGVIPEFGDELNQFIFYQLAEPILIESTFYVGWTKTTNDVLNCGFDKNRNAQDNLFFNVSGQWEKSTHKGALMVRPVFGNEPPDIISVAENKRYASDFDIYPNPAYDILNISTTEDFEYISIFDTNGKLQIKASNKQNIDISNLSSGIYFIQLTSKSKVFNTKKFIVF